jgi:predicted nucleic acid-binding protein
VSDDGPEGPLRVVLDTNVLIAAAFRSESYAGRLVAALRQGRLRLVWDGPTRHESEALLRRIPPISWEDFVDLYREEDRFPGDVAPEAFTAVPDPEDRKFAALASAAEATLVTLDAHLLDAPLGASARVATPRALLERLGET